MSVNDYDAELYDLVTELVDLGLLIKDTPAYGM